MQDLDRISGPERDFHASIQFVYYVQYHLHLQLLDASQYAASHRVVLKGDLPIGVPTSPFPLCVPAPTQDVPLGHLQLFQGH